MIKLVSKKRKPKTLYETGRNEMGLVYADIELMNAGDTYLMRKKLIQEDEVKQVKVRSLVDTGAYMLTINDDVKNQLDLPVIERQFVTLADETQLEVEVVGPVEVRFENRRTTCDAVVLPTARDVLLGSIPMEDMDVLVHPKEQKLVVNPKHPYVANKYLKVAA
jgi:clan AA aspartic protease